MRKDPTEFRRRFLAYKDGKKPYENGKIAIGNNVSNAKLNSDGTFTDDYTRTFDDMIVTPKRAELKRGSYSAKNWNYAKAHRKDWMKTHWPSATVDDKPLEIVHPEFDLLLGGRLIATSLSKPFLNITVKNANRITDKLWDKAYYKALESGDANEVKRLRDLHFIGKANGTKVVEQNGMPSKTYHTVQDLYNPNFTVFNPNIEGSNSAIYTSSDPLMSGTYTNKLVSEYEKNHLAELMRLNELKNIENGYTTGGSAQLRKAILLNPERGRDWIVRNTWLNQPVEPARQKLLYINLQNPISIDNGGRSWNNIDLSQLHDNYGDVYKSIRPHGLLGQGYSTRSLEAAQREAGIYDGAIIKNIADYGGSRKSSILDWSKGNDIYMVNSPSKLKLANPITYDDAGNIIPLSQRDNFSISDIRYLLPYAMGGAATYGANSTQK